MSVLSHLWQPIIVSAILVFILSWLLHVALPWHRNDMKKMPNEDQVMDALRPFNIPPGNYVLPRCDSMKEYKSPAFQEKMKRGPVMFATVRDGSPGMGRSMVLWFLFCLLVSYLAAFVGAHALSYAGTIHEHPHARRLIGLTAFIGYCLAQWQETIWAGRSCVTTLKHSIDALLYAVVTAFVFGWLAPY